MLFSWSTSVLLASAAFALPTLAQTSSTTACNNSPSLCSKAYNNITYLGAHDSAFLRDETTSFSTSGNHYYNTTVQLDSGVRLLTAQVHKYTDNGATEWHLCHSTCFLLDAGKLSKWLTEIKTWMDKNPNDVVTILLVNSDSASAADIGAEYTASGITKYVYKPASSTAPTTWPTLSTLITANTRLVSFVASLGSNTDAPYLMDEFTYIFENSFENTNVTNFSCQPSRPTSLANNPAAALQSNRMFLKNHFLYQTQAFGITVPDVPNIESTNSVNNGSFALGTWIDTCSQTYGKPPNFVLVDFFNVGPAIDSVDRANGVTSSTRKQITTQIKTQQNGVGKLGATKGSMIAAFAGVLFMVVFL